MYATLIAQLHESLKGQPLCPSLSMLEELCDLLYGASLLKEEGRPVRARIVIAPPEGFRPYEGPPDGLQAVPFARLNILTANEIKRLSPAASFFHSALCVWPDATGKFRIWGVLNTGPRWMNQVAGGRKPSGAAMPFPSVHVRDPGRLAFYHDYRVLTEWRGREFYGPGLDVFESPVLIERFAAVRQRFVGDLGPDFLPTTLSAGDYSELLHLLALQFLRRIINLVRSSGHGGSIVIIPDGDATENILTQWVDCKYSVDTESGRMRFSRLLTQLLRRIGQLCEPGATLAQAWQVFLTGHDTELDALEESFFELARLYSDFMQVDGALILGDGLNLVGFGGEIRVGQNVIYVEQAHDLEGKDRTRWEIQGDGTRHRSMYRLCAVEPGVFGVVISQDGTARLIVNHEDNVVFWSHTHL